MTNVDALSSLWKQALKLHKQGDLEEAEKHYQKILEALPDHADTLHYLGLLKRDQGKEREAIDLLEKALQQQPASVDILSNLSAIYIQLDDFFSARKIAENAMSLQRPTQALLLNLVKACIGEKDFTTAISYVDQGESLFGSEKEFSYLRAQITLDLREYDKAAELFKRYLVLDPERTKALYYYGVCQRHLGRDEEAIQVFEQVMERDSNYIDAFCMRNSICKATAEDSWVKHFEQLFSENYCEGVKESKIVSLGYSLGKIYDDLKDYDKAFYFYAKANALVAESTGYSFIENEVTASEKVDLRSILQRLKGAGIESDKPVFIVGMPRSGTTLLEQIMSCHSSIAAAGELPDMVAIADELKSSAKTSSTAQALQSMDKKVVDEMAARYFNRLNEVDADARWVVDKLPINFLFVGLIKTLFPLAKIINIQRHPLDICLSCYFQNFVPGFEYTNSQESLAAVMKLYYRMMGYWNEQLPGEIVTLRYESLVAFREPVLRQLLAYLNIPWEESMLAHENNTRVPNTASHWQARQPLYSSSSFRWKKYQANLGLLMTLLADEIQEYEKRLEIDAQQYANVVAD